MKKGQKVLSVVLTCGNMHDVTRSHCGKSDASQQFMNITHCWKHNGLIPAPQPLCCPYHVTCSDSYFAHVNRAEKIVLPRCCFSNAVQHVLKNCAPPLLIMGILRLYLWKLHSGELDVGGPFVTVSN